MLENFQLTISLHVKKACDNFPENGVETGLHFCLRQLVPFEKCVVSISYQRLFLYFVLFTFGQLLFVVLPLEPDPHHRPLRPWECCHCCLSCCQVGQRVQMDLRKSQRNLRRQRAEVNHAVWKKKKGSFSKGVVNSH